MTKRLNRLDYTTRKSQEQAKKALGEREERQDALRRDLEHLDDLQAARPLKPPQRRIEGT